MNYFLNREQFDLKSSLNTNCGDFKTSKILNAEIKICDQNIAGVKSFFLRLTSCKHERVRFTSKIMII